MKNFEKTINLVDGYAYTIYGNDEDHTKYQKEMVSYAQMAKRFMNKPFDTPLAIVGNYDWHEAFPYEKYLFHKDGVAIKSLEECVVADFGCGPGRMVNRTQKICKKVDGIDISEYAIDYARKTFPNSEFHVSSGIDVGSAPENTYDIVYSTIAIQHIPCKTIRTNIFRGIHNILKKGGIMSIQVAYHPTKTAGVWSHDTEHASYDSDFWNAKATNGHADMIINENDLPTLKSDLEKMFKNVSFQLANVDSLYGNLNGHYHAPYWAQDWLFIQAHKA